MVLVPGTRYEKQMLMTKDQIEPAGKVLQSATREVNRANWQYPNFISKAYGEKASLRFVKAMGIEVQAYCNINDEKDFKKLTTDIKKHLAKRDAMRADMEKFNALRRAEARVVRNSDSDSLDDEPSNDK